MNRDDITRMAQEAGMREGESGDWTAADAVLTYPECVYTENLERFANLVAAAERERIKWDSIHTCNPHCDRPACVAVRRAREDEREMCAQTVESIAGDEQYRWAAMAIRERGAP